MNWIDQKTRPTSLGDNKNWPFTKRDPRLNTNKWLAAIRDMVLRSTRKGRSK